MHISLMNARHVGLAGADWKWAASLSGDVAALNASLSKVARERLNVSAESFAADTALDLAEQDARWGTIRGYKALSVEQRVALVICAQIRGACYLASESADLINSIVRAS